MLPRFLQVSAKVVAPGFDTIQSIQEVVVSKEVLEDARQLAQRLPLRTSDAIHVAFARAARRMLRGLFDGEVKFLAFATALLKAAQAVGFTIPD